MQRIEQAASRGGVQRNRPGVEAVVDTLANLRGAGENLAELAHDARNMVTALGLYCDLLEMPGVLAPAFLHYGGELRLVTAASRRLVEKMVTLDALSDVASPFLRPDYRLEPGRFPETAPIEIRHRAARQWEMLPALPIDDLAGELMANRNLLAALAGPTIALTVDTESGCLPVRLNGEDLTRVLVNLVKNAAQAMPSGGRIDLTLRERFTPQGTCDTLLLTVQDSGTGIPARALDKVFEPGFSTLTGIPANEGWPATHRGLGLSITRSIIEAAGGRISASNIDRGGARLSIELPVWKR